MQIFIALPWALWDHWLISPGSTPHHRDMGTTRVSSFFYYSSSTRLDSLWLYQRQIGRDSDAAAVPYWRRRRLPAAAAISCQLQDPALLLLLSFSFWFPFSFLYRAGWSQVILRWQTLIWARSHKRKGGTSLDGGVRGVRLGRKTRHRLVGK